MRNLGVFGPAEIAQEDLKVLGTSLGGRELGPTELLFGEIPDEAYLGLETSLSGGCFDDEEFRTLQNLLGYPPASYIGIHMGRTPQAFDRALEIARQIQKRWGGQIDYSGAGGELDDPFQPPRGTHK